PRGVFEQNMGARLALHLLSGPATAKGVDPIGLTVEEATHVIKMDGVVKEVKGINVENPPRESLPEVDVELCAKRLAQPTSPNQLLYCPHRWCPAHLLVDGQFQTSICRKLHNSLSVGVAFSKGFLAQQVTARIERCAGDLRLESGGDGNVHDFHLGVSQQGREVRVNPGQVEVVRQCLGSRDVQICDADHLEPPRLVCRQMPITDDRSCPHNSNAVVPFWFRSDLANEIQFQSLVLGLVSAHSLAPWEQIHYRKYVEHLCLLWLNLEPATYGLSLSPEPEP